MAGLFKFLFLVFLIVPIIEIFVLIEVGSVIGALPTIALVVATAVIGAALIRAQGFATLARLQRELASGEMPALTLLEGVFILVAGALLLTPGFVTDIVGFCFLTPPLRRSMAGSIAGQLTRTGGGFARTWRTDSRDRTVIDGEFTEHTGPGSGDDVAPHGARDGRLDPPGESLKRL